MAREGGYQRRDRDGGRDDRPGGGGKFKRFRKRKFCIFCKEEEMVIDYKSIDMLRRFISERGRMLPRRRSGNCAKHQRKVAEEIKRSRYMGMLPYLAD